MLDIPIPARIYDAALAFCNHQMLFRASREGADAAPPLLTALTSGLVRCPYQCPIANTIGNEGISVSGMNLFLEDGRMIKLPEKVKEFIRLVDQSSERGVEVYPVRLAADS